MTSTDTDLIEFIRGFRGPVPMREVTKELETLGKHGADWPRASVDHWRRELLRLAATGQLKCDKDLNLSVPFVTDDRPKQGTLF